MGQPCSGEYKNTGQLSPGNPLFNVKMRSSINICLQKWNFTAKHKARPTDGSYKETWGKIS